MMMTGTTMGDINTPVMIALPGMVPRERPNAAAVPMIIASRPVGTTISMLVVRESNQAGSAKILRYHCIEKPGGGNIRNCAELNEMITTMIIGATRNITNSTVIRTRKARHQDSA